MNRIVYLAIAAMLCIGSASAEQATNKGKDLVYFVVDRSQSIATSRLDEAFSQAINNHVADLSRNTDVEIVFFGDKASKPKAWYPLDAQAKQEFAAYFKKEFKPRGKTRLYSTAAAVLGRVIARESEYDRINVFILSDGEDTASGRSYKNWADVVKGLPDSWKSHPGFSVVWAVVEFKPKEKHIPPKDCGIEMLITDRTGMPRIFSAPKADIIANPTRVKVGSPVTFRLLDDRNADSVTWKFSDGGQKSGTAIDYSFNNPGKYDVGVLVTGPGGNAKQVKPQLIEVFSEVPLHADFSWHPNVVRVGNDIRFTDESTGGTTAWLWQFEDGKTADKRNPSVIFSKPGKTSAKLTVQKNGKQNSAIKNLIVLPQLPSADFSTSTSDAELGTTITLSATKTMPTWKHTWTIDGNEELHGPKVQWTADRIGRIDLCHTVTNPGGQMEENSFVLIREGPDPLIAKFKWAPEVARVGTPISFIDESLGTPTKHHWTFGTAGESADRSPSFTFAETGKVSVVYTISCDDRSHEITEEFEVLPEIIALTAGFTISKESGFNPLKVTFENISKGAIATYEWDFGDGQTSDMRNPVHSYKKPGSYKPRLTIHTAKGEEARDAGTYSISVIPSWYIWAGVAAAALLLLLFVWLTIRPRPLHGTLSWEQKNRFINNDLFGLNYCIYETANALEDPQLCIEEANTPTASAEDINVCVNLKRNRRDVVLLQDNLEVERWSLDETHIFHVGQTEVKFIPA